MINRVSLGRIVYAFYLIIFCLKYDDGLLLSQQLVEPALPDPKLNISHWLFLISGIKKITFSSYPLRFIIDLLLFGLAIICLINPRKVFFCILFALLLWLYQFLYNTIATHFAIGILFACLPFIFQDNIRFFIVFNFCRYFLCGLYFLAGCLKLYNLGAFNLIQMDESIRMSVYDYIFHNPIGLRVQLIEMLLYFPLVSYILFIMATLLELFFFIGFLTKKYDLMLVFLFLAFHIMDYLILDLTFVNHFIILIFFIPLKVKVNPILE